MILAAGVEITHLPRSVSCSKEPAASEVIATLSTEIELGNMMI